MANHGFTLSAEIAAPLERVHAFLSDLHNFHRFHPLIVAIRDLDPRPDRPTARHYEIDDVIPVGPFRLKARYRAVIEVVSPTELCANAWQKPGVELETRYELAPSPAGTRLTERVAVHAPLLLRGFVRRQAEASHAATLERLRTHLAEPQPTGA